MPSFVNPSLLAWPLLMLIGVPILIHLINMLRHRRIPWAAMEFLLVSQKKNRRWIWMKQLLLLLLRMAAIAVVLLMVSQWVLSGSWSKIFGGSTTHHIVLVDDSYSMSATTIGGSNFDRAAKVIERLSGRIAGEQSAQKFTLLTFSQAVRADWDPEHDLISASVGNRQLFQQRVTEALKRLEVSQLSTGPVAALEGLEHLLRDETANENRVIHLLTDFRAREWKDAPGLKQRLSDLGESEVQLHLINCTAAAEPNLAVTALSPEPGVRAAGVPLMMSVSIKNYGRSTVRGVVANIDVSQPPLDIAAVDRAAADDWTKLPPIRIDEIEPGRTVTKRFQTRFAIAGQHVIRASLEGKYLVNADSVLVDNRRYRVVDIASEVPLLLIDGDPKDNDVFFLTTALRPGGATRTGLSPVIKPASFLREAPLEGYGVIYLLNIGRLDDATIKSLESYVRQGGGVIFFMGPNTDRRFVNRQLYRDGEGIFPLPLLGPMDLLVDALEPTADVVIHEKSSLGRLASPSYQTSAVRISRYISVPSDWKPAANSTIQVIAHLRNGAPLIVEQKQGRGTVVAVLTTAGRAWNNWATVMSYPIMLPALQAKMLSAGAATNDALVGAPISIAVDAKQFKSDGKFLMYTPRPSHDPLRRVELAVEAGDQQMTLGSAAHERAADVAGIYELSLASAADKAELQRIVRNVSSHEGDLAKLDNRELATQLKGVDYVYHGFADIQSPSRKIAGYNTGLVALYFLIALLIGEQILSYFASYHPVRVEGDR